MEELAPAYLALENDPVGLQVGDPGAPLEKVLVTLEVTPDVIREARESGANLIISHHPLIFQPLTALDYRSTTGEMIKELVQGEINLFVAHSNLDIAPGGLNFVLSELLGLESRRVLENTFQDRLLKLVVFIPQGYQEQVRDAVTSAGGGWIGNYSHCTFLAEGTGTFLPREGTSPFEGEQGVLEEVKEYRMETVFPVSLQREVLEALQESHPYEEPAYDLYTLEREGKKLGLGSVGELPASLTLGELAQKCKENLGVKGVKVRGDLHREIKTVAVCGGSGSGLIGRAVKEGVDVFISGDLKHHDVQEGCQQGLALIDAGHCGTEKPVVGYLVEFLRERLQVEGCTREVRASSMRELGGDWFV